MSVANQIATMRGFTFNSGVDCELATVSCVPNRLSELSPTEGEVRLY